MELSESFYIFLTNSSTGLILAILKSLYDSKCKNIKLCGLEIERDINAENHRIDVNQSLDRPVQSSSIN